MKHWSFAIVMGNIGLLLLTPQLLRAQALEEVVVTAQKRAQSLQDVAISVAVVTGDELARRQLTQISDLAKTVPGFTFGSSTSDAGSNIIVRGVGTQTFARSVDQSVSTVVDNVTSPSVSGSLLDFSDVERIEVLRGPQGMLFGKNASAGLLNITTKRPTEEFTAGVSARYGSENLLNLSGNVSGPIIDEALLGRLSAFSNTSDGIIENTFPGADDLNDRDDWGLRGKLQWYASDNLDLLFNYAHVERDHRCCIGPLRVVDEGSVADREGGPVGPNVETIFDNDVSTGNTESDVYSLEANYAIGDYVLTAISTYAEDEIFGAATSDLYSRTALPRNDAQEDYEQFTQEIRITSPADRTVSYVAGLYYYDWQLDSPFLRVIDIYGVGLSETPDSGAITVTNALDSTKESMAIFGQTTWNVTDSLRFSAGARYNDDELSMNLVVGFLPGTIPEAPPGEVDESTSEQEVSWRVIAEYDVTEYAMVYSSIARGYKGPGANSLSSAVSSEESVFVDPEIPTNYEVGIKSEWFDNRLRLNGAVFYTQFEDFQASAQVPDAFPPIFFLTNAGELETEGVELEVLAQLSENLVISGAIAYTDAIFSDWKDAPCYSGQTQAQGCVDEIQDLSGADMPNSPDWAFNVSTDYYLPLQSQPFDGFVKATYFWRDDVQFDTTNNPLFIGDSYGQFDLSVGIAASDGRYSATAYVLNLFDSFHEANITGQSVVGIQAAHGLPYDYTTRYGVSLELAF